MQNETKILEIMARIQALRNSAKRYHWQCFGNNFGSDHELFDRIASTFAVDDVDELAEIWYMGQGRDHISDLNLLDEFTLQYICTKFEFNNPADQDLNTKMFVELKKKIDELLPLLNTDIYGIAVRNILDELNSKYTQVNSLILARISRQPKVFSRLFNQ